MHVFVYWGRGEGGDLLHLYKLIAHFCSFRILKQKANVLIPIKTVNQLPHLTTASPLSYSWKFVGSFLKVVHLSLAYFAQL